VKEEARQADQRKQDKSGDIVIDATGCKP
jgi:hypothetical protein